MPQIERIGDIKLLWGESLRWDDRCNRLYFVDCAAQKLHWLEDGSTTPAELKMPSMPTGLVLTQSGRVIVVLEDGVYLVAPDDGICEKIADNPASGEPRLNDAQADRNGNLVTGSLGFGRNPVGSFWFLSRDAEWKRLDRGVSDANGPAVTEDGRTLLIVDTAEKAVFKYAYDGAQGSVGPQTVLADTTHLPGLHDGATLDAHGNYWSTMTGGSLIVCIAPDGTVRREIQLPVDYPTSLAFGGLDRDRLYVTSVSLEFGEVRPVAKDAGALLEISGLGVAGAREPRFAI